MEAGTKVKLRSVVVHRGQVAGVEAERLAGEYRIADGTERPGSTAVRPAVDHRRLHPGAGLALYPGRLPCGPDRTPARVSWSDWSYSPPALRCAPWHRVWRCSSPFAGCRTSAVPCSLRSACRSSPTPSRTAVNAPAPSGFGRRGRWRPSRPWTAPSPAAPYRAAADTINNLATTLPRPRRLARHRPQEHHRRGVPPSGARVGDRRLWQVHVALQRARDGEPDAAGLGEPLREAGDDCHPPRTADDFVDRLNRALTVLLLDIPPSVHSPPPSPSRHRRTPTSRPPTNKSARPVPQPGSPDHRCPVRFWCDGRLLLRFEVRYAWARSRMRNTETQQTEQPQALAGRSTH